MKNFIILFLVLVIFGANFIDKNASEVEAKKKKDQAVCNTFTNSKASKLKIPINKGDFEILVEYIERKGSFIGFYDKTREYSFQYIDSDENFHAFLLFKEGVCINLSVMAFKGGITDSEHFFRYGIDSKFIHPIKNFQIKKKKIVAKAFEELIKKIS